MSKQCENCGKKQNVQINQKVYCVGCGQNIQETLRPAKYQTQVPDQLSTKDTLARPTNNKPHASNLLDLSNQSQKIQYIHKGYRPAQSIHGVRKPDIGSSKIAKPIKKAMPKLQTHRASQRQKRASTIQTHPRVSKFPKNQAIPEPAYTPYKLVPAQTMSPHSSYEINPLLIAKSYNSSTKVSNAQMKNTHQEEQTFGERVRQSFAFLTQQRRLASVVAVSLTVLLVASYVTYLNVPSVAVRVAASRAGIDAQMPNYRPPGYSFSGPVSYSPGQLTIRFNSEFDSSYLALTQRKTDWDPPTLLESYVLPNSQHYRTYNQNGLTIYVFAGNNAAWINNGIFYTIEGENLLSEEQVLRMAASL